MRKKKCYQHDNNGQTSTLTTQHRIVSLLTEVTTIAIRIPAPRRLTPTGTTTTPASRSAFISRYGGPRGLVRRRRRSQLALRSSARPCTTRAAGTARRLLQNRTLGMRKRKTLTARARVGGRDKEVGGVNLSTFLRSWEGGRGAGGVDGRRDD